MNGVVMPPVRRVNYIGDKKRSVVAYDMVAKKKEERKRRSGVPGYYSTSL